jgi:hypothetical protein
MPEENSNPILEYRTVPPSQRSGTPQWSSMSMVAGCLCWPIILLALLLIRATWARGYGSDYGDAPATALLFIIALPILAVASGVLFLTDHEDGKRGVVFLISSITILVAALILRVTQIRN